MTAIARIHPGGGRVVVRRYGQNVVFSEMSSTYPLKLLSPRVDQDGLAVLYALTYGGGLVGGDSVALTVDVGPSAALVVLTQGSTKVFKTRYEARAARPQPVLSTTPAPTTQQNFDVTIADDGALFLLPDPVTCFGSASYSQTQTFRLSDRASLVLLDWFTSGRMSLGEKWAFSRYHSTNEIWVGGERVLKDAMLLENVPAAGGALSERTIEDKLAPYSCYATLILCGPLLRNVMDDLTARYMAMTVFKTKSPAPLLWSLSALERKAYVVRVAGITTEGVKDWFREALQGLEPLLGIDVFRRAFAR